jgi:hypothetical protein
MKLSSEVANLELFLKAEHEVFVHLGEVVVGFVRLAPEPARAWTAGAEARSRRAEDGVPLPVAGNR